MTDALLRYPFLMKIRFYCIFAGKINSIYEVRKGSEILALRIKALTNMTEKYMCLPRSECYGGLLFTAR